MNIEQLRYFSEIARCGSFGKAAEALYTTQQNLSSSIKKLERELGSAVFARSNTGVTLTEFGEQLLPYAKSVISLVSQMPGSFFYKSAKTVSKLSVAAMGYTSISYVLGQMYDEHVKDGISIDYHDVPRSEAISYVADGMADVGFCSIYDFEKDHQLQLFENAGVEFVPLVKTPLAVTMGPKNPLFTREEDWVTIDMLKDFPVIYRFSEYPATLQKKLGLSRKNTVINCNTRAGRTDLRYYTDCICFNPMHPAVNKKIESEHFRRVFWLKDVDVFVEQGYIKRQNEPLTPLAEEFTQRFRRLLSD